MKKVISVLIILTVNQVIVSGQNKRVPQKDSTSKQKREKRLENNPYALPGNANQNRKPYKAGLNDSNQMNTIDSTGK